MSAIEIDKQKILDELKKTEYQAIGEQIKKVKKEFDWNPFNKDGDEYVTAWDEFKHNIKLINNLITKVIVTVEKIAVTVLGVSSGGAKLEAAVQYLDDVVKLPFFAEFVDAPFFRLIISFAVDKINEKYGNDWRTAGLLET